MKTEEARFLSSVMQITLAEGGTYRHVAVPDGPPGVPRVTVDAVARGRRGSYGVGIARREAILDSAAGHFARGDYHRTPMARIAEDVGITEGGLLHHFPSKKHLLLAVAERRLDAASARIDALPDDAGVREVFGALVDVTRLHLAEPGLMQLFVVVSAEAADASSPAHALFARRYDRAVTGLTARLDAAVRRGELHEGADCTALARECIAVSDGLQLQWLLTGGGLDLVAQVRDHFDRLLRGVSVDGTGLGAG